MAKKIFIIKNFKSIYWKYEEQRILQTIKSNYQIQNITLDDFEFIYFLTTHKLTLINKTSPTIYNSLKGNTIKKTINY